MPLVLQIVLIQVVAFGGLVLALRRILYSMSATEAARLQRLSAQNEEQSREIVRKLDETEEECQLRRQQADHHLREARAKAREDAAEVRQEILAKARQEAEAITQRALNMRDQVEEDAEAMAAAKGAELAFRLLAEVLTGPNQAALHEGFVLDSLDELAALDPRLLAGASAEGRLVTARPLAFDAVQRFRAVLADKAGHPVTLTEETDPGCIAGVAVRLGNLEIDGTLRARLSGQAETVQMR